MCAKFQLDWCTHLCEVCKMKDDKEKQTKNFTHSYLSIGWSNLLQILHVELPTLGGCL